MALLTSTWYCNFGNGSSTGYYAVTQWAASASIAAGTIRRQLAAPAVGSERCFVCIVAGTSGGAEPAWVLTVGAKTTDNTVTWQECSGQPGVNGDVTSSPSWTSIKGLAIALGQIIKRDNAASYQICTTAGTAGSGAEPAFSNTAGTTTADNTVTWTSLGAVGNFSAWGAPHARMANVGGTWAPAGSTIYVGDNHAESQASAISVGGVGTIANPAYYLCVDRTVALPPGNADLRTTATATVTANSTSLNISSANGGGQHFYGITFAQGSAVTGAGQIIVGNVSGGCFLLLEQCVLQLGASQGATASILFGTTGAGADGIYVELRNSKTKAGVAGHTVALADVQLVWRGGGIDATSANQTNFITPSGTHANAQALLEGLDLSVCTGNLFNQGASQGSGSVNLKDCRINASATISTTPTSSPSNWNINVTRCDSGATNYKNAHYRYQATETVETSITRVGGAQAADNQLQSRKIVTTANVKWISAYQGPGMTIWNSAVGASKTATIYGTWNQAAVPNNDDIWFDLEYLGSSSNPQGSFVNSTKASPLAANAALAIDGSSWNGGGSGAGWSPFKMSVNFTPQQQGLVYARVRAGKPSSTFYVDPQIVLT